MTTKVIFKPARMSHATLCELIVSNCHTVVPPVRKGTRLRESGDVTKRATLDPSGTMVLACRSEI